MNVIEDAVQCIVMSAVLGRNSQNKPNGFSIHVVLRSGAEIVCGRKNGNEWKTSAQSIVDVVFGGVF